MPRRRSQHRQPSNDNYSLYTGKGVPDYNRDWSKNLGLKADYAVPEDLYYTKEHEWVRIEAGKCRVGVTDYAQKSLHEVVYVELPKVGSDVANMQSLGTVESVKAVADVYSPISGRVLEVNSGLSDAPELVNKNPYGEGWITIIQPANLQKDLTTLMKPAQYKELLLKISQK